MALTKQERIQKVNTMLALLSHSTFIVYDTESTHFAPNHNYGKLTQIAGQKYVDGKEVSEFNRLINPQININSKIVELTGISNALVAREKTYPDVLGEFYCYCAGKVVLVMHNAPHDMKFINYFGVELGLSWEQPVIDTQVLAKFLLSKEEVPEGRYTLAALAKKFNITNNQHHRADNDARVTWQILCHLKEIAVQRGLINTTDELVDTEFIESRGGVFTKCTCVKASYWKTPLAEGLKESERKERIYMDFVSDDGIHFCTLYYDFGLRDLGVKSTSFPLTHWTPIKELAAIKCLNKFGVKEFRELKTMLP